MVVVVRFVMGIVMCVFVLLVECVLHIVVAFVVEEENMLCVMFLLCLLLLLI